MSSSDNLSNKIANEVNETSDTSMNLIKRILPLFVLLLIASLLWMFFNKSCTICSNSTEAIADSTQSIIPAATDEVDSMALIAKEAWASLGAIKEVKLPDGMTISVPENGFEIKLIEFLNNGCKGDLKKTWFNCDRLLFNTGSAELNQVSMEQIDGLTKIFNAYPNAKFRIGGYTDNIGNPQSNQKLSGERAAAVLNSIAKNGVVADRLNSEGYGQEHPECASNDTDECRAKNRRVAIRVEQCN
jgi:outer membrane protein OmpA-like peptidoglycan-associated protein